MCIRHRSPDADTLVAQILEIAYPGIGASDDGECLRIERDQHAELRIRPGGGKRSLTVKGRIGNVGLRQAKR
jgi:hypothetical protein